MKKAEALTVLHELKDAFQESLPVDAISLDRFPPPKRGFCDTVKVRHKF